MTTPSGTRLSVLVLADDSRSHAPNVLEHIRAFRRFSRHRVDTFNPRGLGHSRLLRLDNYDVVVVHYTLVVLSDDYLAPWFRERVNAFSGLKVQFIQDEYRRVDAVAERIRELGIDMLFSSMPVEAATEVYGPRLPDVDVHTTLTGYVPSALENLGRPPLAGRPLAVVYRGRSIPYWLGRLGQDKAVIGREFLARAATTGLRCDIAWTESERIYGEEWYRFLASARTTLGTESGASIVDFDGSVQELTESYVKARPGATFDEVEREVLAAFEGNVVIQAVSPRVFEAAALGTAMVNFVGRYSDVIEPWTHYLPLEKDFSNFDEVVAAIQEDSVLEPIASRAHADLVASGRYSLKTFVRGFDREIESRVAPAQHRPRPRGSTRISQTLLSLEQLRSRERRAELPLVASLRARALERVEARLVRRFPELETLAQEEPEGPQRERVVHDLARLAAAAAAHLRELRYFGAPFDVQVELDEPTGRVTLAGMRKPPQDASELERLQSRLAAAIREHRVEEIVWDNSAVGESFTFITIPITSLEVGYHAVVGAHRFTALLELARRDPEGVIRAFEPLFRRRPDVGVHELDRRSMLLLRLLSRPRETAALWAATIRAGLGAEDLRRLLCAYLGSRPARGDAPIDVLFKDLFRLGLVGESRTSVTLDSEGKTLVYRTTATGVLNGVTLDAATVSSLERIVWDHSAAGMSVTSNANPRVSVTLDGGRHEFEALTPLARRFPELAAPLLARAARTP